jgi:hypothetical protein
VIEEDCGPREQARDAAKDEWVPWYRSRALGRGLCSMYATRIRTSGGRRGLIVWQADYPALMPQAGMGSRLSKRRCIMHLKQLVDDGGGEGAGTLV